MQIEQYKWRFIARVCIYLTPSKPRTCANLKWSTESKPYLTGINVVYALRPCVLLKSTLCRWTLDEHDISWDRIEDVALYRNSDNTYFVENRAIDFTQFERQTKFIRCRIWFSECFVINLFKIFVGNEFDLLMHIEFVKNYFDYILMLEFQSFNRFHVKRCPPHHLNSHWYESVQLLPG